jgi:hypothetical protein
MMIRMKINKNEEYTEALGIVTRCPGNDGKEIIKG